MASNIKNKQKIKDWGVGTVIIYFVMIVFALVCLFPLLYEVLLSFASQKDYLSAKYIIIPRDFNFESYKYILFQDRIGTAFLISVFVTVVGTLYTMIFNSIGAYILTKQRLPGKNIFFTCIIITMFFDGGLIPFYLVVKELNMCNKLSALIIPFAVDTFNMILLRNFFRQVPDEMIEACKIDGAGEIRILLQFVLPLSTAGLATIGMFTIVGKWNDWYWPLIFLTLRDELFPLALELRNVLTNTSTGGVVGGYVDMTKVFSQAQNAAMVVISVLPIVILYPFMQKFLVKGVMMGSIKS